MLQYHSNEAECMAGIGMEYVIKCDALLQLYISATA